MTNEEIISKLASLEKETQQITVKFQQDIRAIDSKIAVLRSKCLHEETTYYPDPSGNNDSFYCCNICGAEAKKFKRKV